MVCFDVGLVVVVGLTLVLCFCLLVLFGVLFALMCCLFECVPLLCFVALRCLILFECCCLPCFVLCFRVLVFPFAVCCCCVFVVASFCSCFLFC